MSDVIFENPCVRTGIDSVVNLVHACGYGYVSVDHKNHPTGGPEPCTLLGFKCQLYDHYHVGVYFKLPKGFSPEEARAMLVSKLSNRVAGVSVT